MGGRLAGKTALITAAGQGIGQATRAGDGARRRARSTRPTSTPSCSTAFTRRRERHHAARSTCSTTRPSRATFDELPPLDVLFNCAGYVHNGTILDCTPKDWDFSFNLNVRAHVRGDPGGAAEDARAARAGGRAQHHQHGVGRRLDQGPAQPLRLRREQGGRDRPDQGGRRRLRAARASAATRSRPGTVDTPSLRDRINAFADPVEARKISSPASRWAGSRKAEEIAPMVVFLASDESAFVTGNVYSSTAA